MPLPVNGAQPTSGYTPAYDGPEQPCYCGNINCIETFISGTGFARRFPAELTSQEIIEAAEQGNPQARAHWQHFIDALARSLASVINILDPQVIVLGGGLSNISRIYQELPDALVPYIFSIPATRALFQPDLAMPVAYAARPGFWS